MGCVEISQSFLPCSLQCSLGEQLSSCVYMSTGSILLHLHLRHVSMTTPCQQEVFCHISGMCPWQPHVNSKYFVTSQACVHDNPISTGSILSHLRHVSMTTPCQQEVFCHISGMCTWQPHANRKYFVIYHACVHDNPMSTGCILSHLRHVSIITGNILSHFSGVFMTTEGILSHLSFANIYNTSTYISMKFATLSICKENISCLCLEIPYK